MGVTFMAIFLSVGGDVPIDSETLLVTDLLNLKIKPIQSFEGAHRSKVCARVFIGVSAHTCMNICVCPVFLKKTHKIKIEMVRVIPLNGLITFHMKIVVISPYKS
jgi:hypothetical protein